MTRDVRLTVYYYSYRYPTLHSLSLRFLWEHEASYYRSRYSYEDITLKPSILYITLLLISGKAVRITLESEDHEYHFLYPQGHILVSVAREQSS
jgi:hypothetical protein